MEKIKDILDKFDFVKWDRAIPCGDDFVDIYGWIDRDKDSYKDFVILSLSMNKIGEWKIWQCLTSSAKYSKKVNKISGFTNVEHTDCIRVDDYLSKLN